MSDNIIHPDFTSTAPATDPTGSPIEEEQTTTPPARDLKDPNRIVTAIAVGQVNSMQAQMILEKLKKGNGYCPCKLQATPDTKCQCKEFRDNMEKLRKYADNEPDPHFNFSCICSCGLFVGQVIKAPFNTLPPEVQAQVVQQELAQAAVAPTKKSEEKTPPATPKGSNSGLIIP